MTVRVQSLVRRDIESRTNIKPCDGRILLRPMQTKRDVPGVNGTCQLVKRSDRSRRRS